MKKYLITSAAALALCGLITSCTHELDYEASVQSSVVKKYEDAFVTAFGKPDPNQEWGFGSSTAATRAMTRDIPGFTKPSFDSDPELPFPYAKTLTDVKKISGAYYAKDNQNYQRGDVIWVDTEYSSLNNPQNTDDLTIYVDGTVSLNTATSQNGNGTVICVTENSTLTMGQVSTNLFIYLAPNATLNILTPLNWDGTPVQPYQDWQGNTVNPSFTFQNPHSGIYLSSGSTVNAGEVTFIANSTVVNYGGTFNANKLTVQDGAFFYNNKDGIIDVENELIIHNTDAEIVNNGQLEAASVNVGAGAKMHNDEDGVVTIAGTTYVDNSNSSWMNDGVYTTGHFEVLASAYDVWNNCKLIVTSEGTTGDGDFHLNRAKFVLDGGASLIADSFTWEDTSNFYLGGKALVDVKGTLLTKNYNSDYGFHGETNEYSVIRAASITKDDHHQYSMSYYGNLYIDTPSHFPQGYINVNGKDQPYYYYDDTVKFGEEKDCPVQIRSGKCNPGYNNEKPSSNTVRVICEDLSVTQASDWDFNDVVFDVQLMNENTQVKITFLAAGGTLPLTVAGEEVHGLFKEANPDLPITQSSMINTGSTGDKYTFRNCEKAYLTINNTFGSNDVKTVAKLIPIQVYKLVNDTKTWVNIDYKKGEPAAKIAVGDDYKWCDERTLITDKFTSTYAGVPYPNFNLYVKGILGDDWYNSKEITYEQKEAYLNR